MCTSYASTMLITYTLIPNILHTSTHQLSAKAKKIQKHHTNVTFFLIVLFGCDLSTFRIAISRCLYVCTWPLNVYCFFLVVSVLSSILSSQYTFINGFSAAYKTDSPSKKKIIRLSHLERSVNDHYFYQFYVYIVQSIRSTATCMLTSNCLSMVVFFSHFFLSFFLLIFHCIHSFCWFRLVQYQSKRRHAVTPLCSPSTEISLLLHSAKCMICV